MAAHTTPKAKAFDAKRFIVFSFELADISFSDWWLLSRL
jgi:hypothetical protein